MIHKHTGAYLFFALIILGLVALAWRPWEEALTGFGVGVAVFLVFGAFSKDP